jgi:beta-glucanase (GH16 family)
MMLLTCLAMITMIQTTAPSMPTTGPAPKLNDVVDGWELVWADEFDAGDAPDPARWRYEVGMLRNNEKQFYTDNSRENVRVENGVLVIEARKERMQRPDKPGRFADYTSGSIETEGLAQWQYGRIEVRAKLPTGRGTWPAAWMMPPSFKQFGWPKCGEIDIVENVGFNPQVVQGTVHTQAYNHVKKTDKSGKLTLESPWTNFHVYAIEWSEKKIDWFVDGRLYHTFANDGKNDMATWPFSQPFHLKLNFAVGGGWGGQKGIDETIWPQRFEIDYGRVWEKK